MTSLEDEHDAKKKELKVKEDKLSPYKVAKEMNISRSTLQTHLSVIDKGFQVENHQKSCRVIRINVGLSDKKRSY